MSIISKKLLQYGISDELANKIISVGLTISKIKSLNQDDLIKKYSLSEKEASFISKAIKRKPININILNSLLDRSNCVCNICKGMKGKSIIIHHIEEYEISQNNNYNNLIVLCPTDHDLAHRDGLTLGLTPKLLFDAKIKWEKEVERHNSQVAANKIDVLDEAIDYVNIKRIEERCMNLYGAIPETTISNSLIKRKILDSSGVFNQKYVQTYLSGGRYLFDYMNCNETEHYKQLMQKISSKVEFHDLDEKALSGFTVLKDLEGQYAFFIGGVTSKSAKLPITQSTQPFEMHYSRKGLKIEWILDPMFVLSTSAFCRLGSKNRYIIYCSIQSVKKVQQQKYTLISASPLMVAIPTKYVDKTPYFVYKKEFENFW